MEHARALKSPLPAAIVIALSVGIAGCEQAEVVQVQQSRWNGDGWTAVGHLPQKDMPLVTTMYNQYKTAPDTRFVDRAIGTSGPNNDGSEQAPWGPLAQAMSHVKAQKVSTLLLKCGTEFREALQAGSNNVAADIAQLRIGMYGDCKEGTRPTISGSDP